LALRSRLTLLRWLTLLRSAPATTATLTLRRRLTRLTL
jgi:hypothetical protein